MAKKNNTPAKPKLPPEEALFQALSLCRKAGALTMGFDAVEDACVKSKAWLVMVASDASGTISFATVLSFHQALFVTTILKL